MRLAFASTICAGMMAPAISSAVEERCFHSPGNHYHLGVSHHLAKAGVPHRVAPQNGVCVPEALAARVEAAMRELDRYFWKVPHHLADPCEESAYVEWAAREKLRFDVGNLVDLQGNTAGRVFHLRSYTREEMDSNRRKLEDAPKVATCRPTTVASRF